MTKQSQTCQIIPFPLHRIRPGLRQHLHACRRMICEAQQDASWVPSGSEVTPDFVAGLIPKMTELYRLTDLEVTDIAQQVSILSMHAIHAGDWTEKALLSDFAELQCLAIKIEDRHGLKASA